jgi:hypothetical protein
MSKVVVSLTTIPSRVSSLDRIIGCLKKQTLIPDRIYLNLPRYSIREKIPYPDYPSDKLVYVNRCDDYGPITKLYPTLLLEKDPETIIITVDDDVDYSEDLIETLVRGAQLHPNSAISGSGFIVGDLWNCFAVIHSPNDWTEVSVIEGYSGCAYRRKFFDADLLDYTGAPSCAFYHDDIWISRHLAKKKISRLVHPGAGYGAQNKLANGLSDNKIKVARQVLSLLFYCKSEGLFNETQIEWTLTFGFWIIFFFILIVLLAIWLLI